MGALDYARAKLHFEVCDHTVRRADVIRFLDRLAQCSPADKFTLLVMDNAFMHHNIDPEIIHLWLVRHRFVLLYLPPYSLELNLIEILWKHVKYHWRAFTSWTRDTLVQEAKTLLNGFGKTFHLRYA